MTCAHWVSHLLTKEQNNNGKLLKMRIDGLLKGDKSWMYKLNERLITKCGCLKIKIDQLLQKYFIVRKKFLKLSSLIFFNSKGP